MPRIWDKMSINIPSLSINVIVALIIAVIINYSLVNGQEIISDKKPPLKKIKIETKPKGSKIYINEKLIYQKNSNIEQLTPYKFTPDSFSIKTIKLHIEGFVDTTFTVRYGVDELIHIVMRPIKARIVFTSKEDEIDNNIEVYEIKENRKDSVNIGTTPCREIFNYGKHTFTYKKRNYILKTETISILDTTTKCKNIILNKETLKLYILSIPDGAEISIDNSSTGNNTNCDEEVTIGNHNVRLEKEGFKPYDETYSVLPNKRNEIEAFLQPIYFKVTVYDTLDKVPISDAKLIFGDQKEYSNNYGEVNFVDPIFPNALHIEAKGYYYKNKYYYVGMNEDNVMLKKKHIGFRPNKISIEYVALSNNREYERFIKSVKSKNDFDDYLSIDVNTYKKDLLNNKLIMDINISLYSKVGIGIKFKPKYTLLKNKYVSVFTNVSLSGGVYGFGKEEITGSFIKAQVGSSTKLDVETIIHINASLIPFYRIPYRTIQNDILDFKAMGWNVGGRIIFPYDFKIKDLNIDLRHVLFEYKFEQIQNEEDMRLRTHSFGIGYIF